MSIGDLVIFPKWLPLKEARRAFQYEVIARCECGRVDCWVGKLPSGLKMHFRAQDAKVVKSKEERAEDYFVGTGDDEMDAAERAKGGP
jgi:hypothetical protein